MERRGSVRSRFRSVSGGRCARKCAAARFRGSRCYAPRSALRRKRLAAYPAEQRQATFVSWSPRQGASSPCEQLWRGWARHGAGSTGFPSSALEPMAATDSMREPNVSRCLLCASDSSSAVDRRVVVPNRKRRRAIPGGEPRAMASLILASKKRPPKAASARAPTPVYADGQRGDPHAGGASLLVDTSLK